MIDVRSLAEDTQSSLCHGHVMVPILGTFQNSGGCEALGLSSQSVSCDGRAASLRQVVLENGGKVMNMYHRTPRPV